MPLNTEKMIMLIALYKDGTVDVIDPDGISLTKPSAGHEHQTDTTGFEEAVKVKGLKASIATHIAITRNPCGYVYWNGQYIYRCT